jgi:hypothetical protein
MKAFLTYLFISFSVLVIEAQDLKPVKLSKS